MSFIRRNIETISCIIIISILIFFYIIIKKIEPFGNMTLVNCDCASQIYPLMCTFQEKLKSGEGLFYSWHGGMGDGFLPTYFYYLASPINLLVVFLEKGDIRSFINITIFLRIIFAAGAFSCFLSKKFSDSNKRIYIIPISIAYALSGFVYGYYHESMWLDSYMVFPLIMLGYDRLLKEKKAGLYIISLVYSSLCSFYMTFMSGLFLVIWFLLDNHENKKKFVKDMFYFAISSALAIGMTFFSIIVSYIGVMKTHVDEEPVITHEWFGNIFNIIKYQFTFSNPVNISYSNNCANIYSGVFCICLVLIYLLIKEIKLSDRIKRAILLIFLLVSMNESILNFVWHGLHYQLCIPNRFSYIFIFLMLLTSFEALESAEDIKRTGIGLVIAELSPILCYFFVDFDGIFGSKKTLIISFAIILLYSILTMTHILVKKKIFYCIYAAFMFVEIIANGYMAFSSDLSDTGIYGNVVSSAEALKYELEQNNDTLLFRSKMIGTTINNIHYMLGINGVESFNSMMNKNLLNFSGKYGLFHTDVSISENGGYEPLDDILGVKYYYSYGEVFLESMGYKAINTKNDVNLYKNENALSMGFAADKDIKNVDPQDWEVMENINRLASSMSGTGDVLEEVFPEYEITGEGYAVQEGNLDHLYMGLTLNGLSLDPYFKISYNIAEAGKYNIYMNYTDYGVIVIYVNDEIRRYEFTNFGGVLALGHLNKDDHVSIVVRSESKMADGYTLDAPLTFELRNMKLSEDGLNSFISSMQERQLKITEISDAYIKGNVNLGEGQVLFTSIPYDKSWHIYENGKELKTEKYANTFLGADIGSGQHELEFKYIPEGFYLGIVVTIVSWIGFVVWMIIIRKNRIQDGKYPSESEL